METELEELRARCDRALNLHGLRSPAAFLEEMEAGETTDVYGEGGAVTALEEEVGELLGKPAVVFMPSGTMAQQIALRIHCDRGKSKRFGCHPASHLLLHEDDAHQELHGLEAVVHGEATRLLTMQDLEAGSGTLGAFLLELPQREIGGQLPEWDDLVRQTELIRAHGLALHLDGARLWECSPYYGKEPREIAALFDSIYVSFYKGLGGLSGCCLAGEEELVAEARVWRHRHGGTLWSSWPLAASGLGALRKRLPLMPRYYEHACAIADALREVDGIHLVPDPPQTPSMHIHMRTTEERFTDTVRSIAEESGIWTFNASFPSQNPHIRVAELAVGDATLGFSPEEVAELIRRFVAQD